MVHQPPRGARDLLPLDVTQKQWVEARLREVFRAWGYHRIITSTLERLDTLMAGDAIQRSSVVTVQAEDEAELGLRPELTASIARAAVTRLSGTSFPLRLYYQANVFRQFHQGGRTVPQEYYQAGIELLGSGGLLADVEALLLLTDCLVSLGLVPARMETPATIAAAPGHSQQETHRQETDLSSSNLGASEIRAAPDPLPWFLVLGEAGLTHSLLEPFPEAVRSSVRHAIAHLDRLSLEALDLDPQLTRYALTLFDLRGEPTTVLERVSALDLTPEQRERVLNLKNLVGLLEDSLQTRFPRFGQRSPLILDLSLVQTFDYYTGIIFEVVRQTDSGQWLLGQGGRYDQLLGVYNPDNTAYPGIGFSLNIETLQQVLLTLGQLPQFTPASDWLVIPTVPQVYNAAIAYAQKLRDTAEPVRVELHLHPEMNAAAVRNYARERRIQRLAWIRPDALPDLEVVR